MSTGRFFLDGGDLYSLCPIDGGWAVFRLPATAGGVPVPLSPAKSKQAAIKDLRGRARRYNRPIEKIEWNNPPLAQLARQWAREEEE